MSLISLMEFAAQEQEPIRKGAVMKVTTDSQLIPRLKFITVDGMGYSYAEMSTLPGVAFRKLNGTYDPSAGVVNPKTEKMAIFGGVVQLDHQLQGTQTHTNAIMGKMRAAALFFDYMFINGNADGTSVDEFDGLKRRLVGNQLMYAAVDGATITSDMVDELLDRVAGPNSEKLLIMSKRQRRYLKMDMGFGNFADRAKPLSSYDEAEIVVMDEDDVEQIVLPQTETRGSCTTTGSIYCIRPGKSEEGEYVQGLVKGKVVDHKVLAQTNTLIGDLVEMFGGIGVFHGRAAARLAGLK